MKVISYWQAGLRGWRGSGRGAEAERESNRERVVRQDAGFCYRFLLYWQPAR